MIYWKTLAKMKTFWMNMKRNVKKRMTATKRPELSLGAVAVMLEATIENS